MAKNQNKNPIFWDYDLANSDLSNPQTKIWYLNRKLQFGDFSDLKRKDLEDYLPNLNIDPSLKELLQNYLNSHA